MDSSNKKALGERIKKFRENLDLTQSELAKRAHKSSPAYIALIESGERNVSTMDLLLIAKGLGTSVAALIGESNQKKKSKFLQALRGSSDVSPNDKKKIEEYYYFLKNRKNG